MTTPFPTPRILGRLIGYRKFDYAILVSQTVIFYAVELLPGLAIQRIFDLIAAGSAIPNSVWIILAGLFASMMLRWGTIPLWFWAEGRFVVACSTLMRRNMLAHVLSRPGARALPGSAGEAISRFRDDVFDALHFLTLLPDMPIQVITLIVMLAILAQTNALLTLVALVPLALSIIAAQLAGNLLQRNRLAVQQAIGQVTGTLGEIFGAVQAIKLAAAEPHVVRAFEGIGETRRKAFLRVTLILQALNGFSWNSSAFATAAVMIAAVLTGDIRRMSPGELALFVTFFSAMNFLVGFFGELFNRYRQTEVNLRRLADLMIGAPPEHVAAHHPVYLNREPPAVPALQRAAPLQTLEVRNLTCTFPGTEAGVRNCSFDVQPGALTVITGRVGAGKTTLLRALLGLLPAEGDVLWNGETVTRRDAFFRPSHSAYVPQIPRLFSDTLRENILMGAPDAALDRAVQLAVFERDVDEFERGLDTPVGVRGAKVSGGQLQRTAAARAFVREADLVVVDDLSSALDVETEALLWQRVLQQASRRAILAVSHRQPALERASHIIVMKDGAIIDQGPLRELLLRCAELREICSGMEIHTLPAT